MRKQERDLVAVAGGRKTGRAGGRWEGESDGGKILNY